MSLAALRVNITRIKKELVSAMRNTQRKINTEMGKNKRQANKNELCTFQDRHLARKQGRYIINHTQKEAEMCQMPQYVEIHHRVTFHQPH